MKNNFIKLIDIKGFVQGKHNYYKIFKNITEN